MFVSKSTLIALIPFLLPTTTYAANDWSKACTSGSCSWDTGDGIETAWSTIAIEGSDTSISDITNAAGWEILGCDGKSTDPQDIRLVCTNPDKQCDSLFKGGAENTLIRLPNSCGGGPFAKVLRVWTHEDQSIPAAVTKKMKRGVADPNHPVRGLRFDFDLTSIPESKGRINMVISSTSNPLQRGSLDNVKRDLRSSRHFNPRLQTRGLFGDFVDKVKDKGKKVIDKVEEGVGKGVDKVIDAGKKVGEVVGDGVDKAKEIAKDINEFDQNFNKDFPPVNVDKQGLTLLDTSINCPPSIKGIGFQTGLKITGDIKMDAKVSMGFLVKGSIVPPKLDDMVLTGAVTSKADMKFNIAANAKGTFDTLKIPFFSSGIPGLSIPGIITLGPKFTLNAQIKADMDVLANMNVTAKWDVDNLKLTFPPEKGASSVDVKPQDTPLDIGMLGAETDSKASVEVHLIPRVEFGIDALAGKAKAVVFLDVDGMGKMDMRLLAANDKSDKGKKLGGCVNLGLGVNIKAGAQGTIPGLFNEVTAVDLFNKQKDIFTKCFGDQRGQEEDFKKTKNAKAVDAPPADAAADANTLFSATDADGNPILDASGQALLVDDAGNFFDQSGAPVEAPEGLAPPAAEDVAAGTEEPVAEEPAVEEPAAEETPADEAAGVIEEPAAAEEEAPAAVEDDGSLFEAVDDAGKPITDKDGNPLLVDSAGAFFNQAGEAVDDSAFAKRDVEWVPIVSEREFQKRQGLLDQLTPFIPALVCPTSNPLLAFQGVSGALPFGSF
jgi:hypothetical protein